MDNHMKRIVEAYRKLQAENEGILSEQRTQVKEQDENLQGERRIPGRDRGSQLTQEVISMARKIGAIIMNNNLRALEGPFAAFMSALETAPEDGGFYND